MYPYDDEDPLTSDEDYPRANYRELFSDENPAIPSQTPQVALSEDDPVLAKYRKAYSEPSNSDKILLGHEIDRPKYENYQSGFMDQLGDAIMAMMFSDPKLLNATQDEKYNRAYQKWKDTGAFVREAADSIDKDKAREIANARFEVQNKATGLQREAIQAQRDEDQKIRMDNEARLGDQYQQTQADRVANQKELIATRKAAQEATAAQREFNRNMATEAAARANESAQRAKEAAAEREQRNEVALKEKARSITQEQVMRDKKLSSYYIPGPDGSPRIKPNISDSDLNILRTTLEGLERMNYLRLKKGDLPQ